MTKQAWIQHIELKTSADINDKEAWRASVRRHKELNPNCPDCKARAKTYKACKARKSRDDVYRSLGLNKVIGAVSGSVYWE